MAVIHAAYRDVHGARLVKLYSPCKMPRGCIVRSADFLRSSNPNVPVYVRLIVVRRFHRGANPATNDSLNRERSRLVNWSRAATNEI